MTIGAYPSLDLLIRRKTAIKADLLMKVEVEDWHGVADAAMDLREIDTATTILSHVPKG